ncbi:hypothetical protein EJ02DRAFT_83632 [Clathrospora elynae]|uniref:Uncharacterized protein n=1 Tax=Clathrospora elynae TaxID=706981 RepID=A0A6A5SXM7_9PLEO|nr:hypothetical protein EJ02DRAFT_83632 [Clathrospora elynae]
MSTTIVTSQRRQTTASRTSQRASATPTTLRKLSTISTRSGSSHLASASSTVPPTTLETDFFSSLQLETAIPTPSASIRDESNEPRTTSTAVTTADTCSTDNDCATNRICSNAKCISINAAPLGGPGSEPTSKLSMGTAIGFGVGVLVLMALMVASSFWFRRIRKTRPRKESIDALPFQAHLFQAPLIQAAPTNRTRSASSATDQKTLVASLPNSPQNVRFSQYPPLAPELFAKVLEYNEAGKETSDSRRPTMIIDASQRASMAEKALPIPPTDNPLPPRPTERLKYAVNVNINKSMVFDNDTLSAVIPFRGQETPRGMVTPRERAPQYNFVEYIPPVASPPSISVTRSAATSKRTSEYELGQYPNTRVSAGTALTTDESFETRSSYEKTLSKSQSKAPVLPLPELPPPSPGFSSYDWYQDIIGDQRTPTQSTFPKSLSFSSKRRDRDSSLVPGPFSPTVPPALHLHPSSAGISSPTSTGFRLSPTVYTMPSRQKVPPIPPPPPPQKSTGSSTRFSTLSTMTRATHNSRSWLPDDGLYLSEEGTFDSLSRFRGLGDDSRPTSYSPLT